MTIAGREWLVAIAPIENVLLMEMLRYADELRNPKDFFDEVPTIKPDKEMVDLAVELIDKKSGRFHPEQFEDHYQTALKKLVQAKSKGRKIIAAPEEPRARGENEVDLMDALRKSVGLQAEWLSRAAPASALRREIKANRATAL